MTLVRYAVLVVLMAFGLAACGAGQVSDADRIATEVARQLAVAQTLTAQAGPPTASSPAIATPTSQVSEPTAVTTTLPTLEAMTATQVSPTPTPAASRPTVAATTVPPTPTPTNTPGDLVPLPTEIPSPTAVRVAEVVRLPGGSSNGVSGELRLRGLIDQPVAETPVVRGQLAFRAVVRDPAAGPNDGDGVLAVHFFVLDPQGNIVYERVEENPAFCLSGGDAPGCDLIDIGPGGTWPDGAPVTYGVHQINMDIGAGADGVNNDRGAFWFTFVDIQPPAE
jgi:hypothetical protein